MIIQDALTLLKAKVTEALGLAVQLVPTPGSQYSFGWETTVLAFTNNVVVFDLRNPTANLVLISKLQAQVNQVAIAAASAAGLRSALQLFVGRNYTALSSTNRTALTLTTNNGKLRTSYSTSGLEVGFASAAAGITTGTITEDVTALATSAQGAQNANITAAASPGVNQPFPSDRELIWEPSPWGGPIILAQNEGIRLRYLVTTAATVTISGYVQCAELGSTTYP